MPPTDISSAVATDLTSSVTDYSVPSETTDGVTGVGDSEYINTDWNKWLGYYKDIPELTAAIDAKATWTVGKGFKADEITTMILMSVKGWGADTFNTILENMIRTYHIGGDAYAEIMLKEGVLINLKPLDPSTIKIIVNSKGRIKRYEQIAKPKNREIPPNKILHLARNRVADEIHGESVVRAVEQIILMRNEAMTDWKRVLHRNVDPLWIYHMDTDDTAKIAAFKAKMDDARGKGESMYVPKGVIVPENVVTAGNASLNPLPWIDSLNEYFYEAVGVPKIIVGSSRAFTEASAKIAYLAFQQTIEEEQLFIEEQVLAQLNLAIELEFPASLENELLSDKKKDGDAGGETAAVASDTTAGRGE